MSAPIKLLAANLALSLLSCPGAAPSQPAPAPWEGSGYAPLNVARVRADGWRTDFEASAVDLSQVFSADLPRDAIPAITAPRFVPSAAADLDPDQGVVVVAQRAYPVAVLLRHELVNDELGGVPIAVTYCSLCDSALVYERRVGGAALEFGVSGFLRRGNALLYDRATDSLWQQLTGEALVGDHAGARLKRVPASVVPFAAFAESIPEGEVLAFPAGFSARVRTPAAGYDTTDAAPTHLFGPVDARFPAMQPVLGLDEGGVCRAIPLVGPKATPLFASGERVVLDDGRTRSPFGTPGRRGSAALFDPRLDERVLHFERDGEHWSDRETGSTWSSLGVALRGPLAGRRLTPLAGIPSLWHALAAHAEVAD